MQAICCQSESTIDFIIAFLYCHINIWELFVPYSFYNSLYFVISRYYNFTKGDCTHFTSIILQPLGDVYIDLSLYWMYCLFFFFSTLPSLDALETLSTHLFIQFKLNCFLIWSAWLQPNEYLNISDFLELWTVSSVLYRGNANLKTKIPLSFLIVSKHFHYRVICF